MVCQKNRVRIEFHTQESLIELTKNGRQDSNSLQEHRKSIIYSSVMTKEERHQRPPHPTKEEGDKK